MPDAAFAGRARNALPAVLDQRSVDAAREMLLAAFASGPVTVDASAVERINTVGVQFLLSAARTAEALGHPLAVVAPSPALVETFAALGLTSKLTEWTVQ